MASLASLQNLDLDDITQEEAKNMIKMLPRHIQTRVLKIKIEKPRESTFKNLPPASASSISSLHVTPARTNDREEAPIRVFLNNQAKMSRFAPERTSVESPLKVENARPVFVPTIRHHKKPIQLRTLIQDPILRMQ